MAGPSGRACGPPKGMLGPATHDLPAPGTVNARIRGLLGCRRTFHASANVKQLFLGIALERDHPGRPAIRWRPLRFVLEFGPSVSFTARERAKTLDCRHANAPARLVGVRQSAFGPCFVSGS
jgi:hypothetical protein